MSLFSPLFSPRLGFGGPWASLGVLPVNLFSESLKASIENALTHAIHEFTEPVDVVERGEGGAKNLVGLEEMMDVGP